MNSMQEPVAAQSETSAADNEPEIEQETVGTTEIENTNATPSPPLSPAASDTSETQSGLVNQSQESPWREVAVSGGE